MELPDVVTKRLDFARLRGIDSLELLDGDCDRLLPRQDDALAPPVGHGGETLLRERKDLERAAAMLLDPPA